MWAKKFTHTETKSMYTHILCFDHILVNSLFTVFAANTQECTHAHYQYNIRTYHSSQLTPIYPTAFKKRSGKKKEKKKEALILHLCNITGLWGSKYSHGWEAKASDSPQYSAAKWNNANRALITTGLVRSFQLAAITLSVNSPTKSQTITH